MHHQLTLALMLVVPAVVLTLPQAITRAFNGAIGATDISQKVAADRAGISVSQLSRQLKAGKVTILDARLQGREFWFHFTRLLDALDPSVDAQPSQERRSA